MVTVFSLVFWFICAQFIRDSDSTLYFLVRFVKDSPVFSLITFIFVGALIDKKISDFIED
jgi:hypothetical protein